MNIVDTNEMVKLGYGKLSYSDIYNLCVFATEAGIKLPTKFVDRIYTLIYDDPRSLEEMNEEFDASILFEFLNWQDRMTDQWQ
jgi:hypothetical protein